MEPAPIDGDVETSDGWRTYIERNVAPEFQGDVLSYVAKLMDRGLPVIFDLKHLAGRVGLPAPLMRAMVAEPRLFYRQFHIPKRRGGLREIQSPYPAAASTQAWISEFVLSHLPVGDQAHGFVRHRSIVTNAREHLGARCILRLDIQDFFPSIGLPRVIAIFKAIGYNQEASYALARVCTLNDRLPQGASTSPVLANLVARRLDFRLGALAASLSLIYTRYADDLVFSGSSISLEVPKFVAEILGSEGFQLNSAKTLLARGAQRKIITGVSVSSTVTRIPREMRRRLRSQVYRALRDPIGIASLASENGLAADPQHLQRLLASLAYWKHVEPTSEFAASAHSKIKAVISELRTQVGSTAVVTPQDPAGRD